MKRFISKIIVLFAVIAVVILSVNSIFIEMDHSNSEGTDRFSDIPEKIDYCNFGSSHGLYAFNYEDVEAEGDACFNFALSSQYFSYDYRLMRYYGNRIRANTNVFIPVSYFVPFGKGEEELDNFESINKRYYKILPPDLVKEYDFKTTIFEKYLPSLRVDTETLINTFSGETADNNSIAWQQTVASANGMHGNAVDAFDRHFITKEIEKEDRKVNKKEVEALYSLICECKKRGATPVLITTPYLQEYTNYIEKNAPGFYKDYYELIDKVARDTGVSYYDYAFDERFSKNYSLFMNVDHLNKEGARKFTNILVKETVR